MTKEKNYSSIHSIFSFIAHYFRKTPPNCQHCFLLFVIKKPGEPLPSPGYIL
ncbi:hypothetical protein LAF9269_01818 [Limosilactobacillus fermentum]|nr:hypothetical protein LAF9269_01818 [Limosilactobacillus fermentum]